MTRILILGATGNIASLVAEALAARPEATLRLTSTRDEGVETLKRAYPKAEVVKADWHRADTLPAAFDGVDRVLMITPDFITDEVLATTNVVEAAKAASTLDHFVRLTAVYPNVTDADITEEWFGCHTGSALKNVTLPIMDASGLPVTYVNVAAWIAFNLMWFGETDVKDAREMAFPRRLDAPRTWITEQDIRDVIVKILFDGPAYHAGKEHVLTGQEHFGFDHVTALLSAEVGEPVRWVDSEAGLRRAAGENAELLLTYISSERKHCASVPVTDTVERLLGRRQETLAEYIAANRDWFA